MAIEVALQSEPFHVGIYAEGPPPANKRIPYPDELPGPVWSGFDTTLATYVVDADGRGVTLTPLDKLGMFTLAATVEGFAPATLEITLIMPGVHHFVLEVDQAAPPAP